MSDRWIVKDHGEQQVTQGRYSAVDTQAVGFYTTRSFDSLSDAQSYCDTRNGKVKA